MRALTAFLNITTKLGYDSSTMLDKDSIEALKLNSCFFEISATNLEKQVVSVLACALLTSSPSLTISDLFGDSYEARDTLL